MADSILADNALYSAKVYRLPPFFFTGETRPRYRNGVRTPRAFQTEPDPNESRRKRVTSSAHIRYKGIPQVEAVWEGF